MARNARKVPYGFEPPKAAWKGTVLVFETFEDWSSDELRRITDWAEEKKFARVILYPQHEETLRRMGIPSAEPYYARIKLLRQLIADSDAAVHIEVDAWEGKRKKYTPLDTSLNFLTDKYPGPVFVAMNDRYVNEFVTYPSFREWIRKVRLAVLVRFHVPLNGMLEAYSERWETIGQ